MRGDLNHHPPSPIEARLTRSSSSLGPAAYDWFRLIFIREGTAIVFSEFGKKPARPRDVVLVSPNVLCGCEPEGLITTTTVFIDQDFLADQVFWQHCDVLGDKLEVSQLLKGSYFQPAQMLRLAGTDFAEAVPQLDELTRASQVATSSENFLHREVLLLNIWRRMIPHIETTTVRPKAAHRRSTQPSLPRRRTLLPLRPEARKTAEMMRADLARRWTLAELAEVVHLSIPQFHRVFVDAYGKTPKTYLTMLRAVELARLLRETDLPIGVAMRQVGWNSRGEAARFFCQYVGLTPARYRATTRQYSRSRG